MDISNNVDLPTEKALGMRWNIEKDTLRFKVNLGKKPLTRCEMLSIVSKIYHALHCFC